jgi:hypothetical protein
MVIPNLDRIVETFIQVPLNDLNPTIKSWQIYVEILYEKLIPLLDKLKNKKLIKSFSFLIHNKDNGVPTNRDDNNPYIHLRFELGEDAAEEDLQLNLPDYCLFTQKGKIQSPYIMSGIESKYLVDEDFRYAWMILSDSSELVVEILKIHKDKNLPIQHVAQFFHFLGNQLLVKLINIPMP